MVAVAVDAAAAAARGGAALPAAAVDWSTLAVLALGVLLLVMLLLQEHGSRQPTGGSAEAGALRTFQWLYLPPFLLATFADWVQGPYQYKVYTSYGFDEHDIGRLYICGFGSSLLFGTYVAGVSDTCAAGHLVCHGLRQFPCSRRLCPTLCLTGTDESPTACSTASSTACRASQKTLRTITT